MGSLGDGSCFVPHLSDEEHLFASCWRATALGTLAGTGQELRTEISNGGCWLPDYGRG